MLTPKVNTYVAIWCVLLSVLCEAWYPEHPYSRFSPRQNTFNLEKREDLPESCFPLCAPNHCGPLGCGIPKRSSPDAAELASNKTGDNPTPRQRLGKRLLFGPTQANIDSYFKMQNESPYIHTVCPVMAGGFDSPSYCIQRSFASAPLTNNQFLVGTANVLLEGSTVLVVASSRGVYMCHFWEDIHYPGDPGSRWRNWYTFKPVLNMIRGEGDTTYAVGPRLERSLFEQKHPFERTVAFIMTPRYRQNALDPKTRNYPLEHIKLRQLLLELIPHVDFVEYNYYPFQPIGVKLPSYRGRALFEYDTNADGANHRDWRLWMEQATYKASDFGIAIDVEEN